MAGLKYAKQQGISIRDVKMSNVLMFSEATGSHKFFFFSLSGRLWFGRIEGEDDADSEGFSRRTSTTRGLGASDRRQKRRSASDIFLQGTILRDANRRAGALHGQRPCPGGAKSRYREDIKPVWSGTRSADATKMVGARRSNLIRSAGLSDNQRTCLVDLKLRR